MKNPIREFLSSSRQGHPATHGPGGAPAVSYVNDPVLRQWADQMDTLLNPWVSVEEFVRIPEGEEILFSNGQDVYKGYMTYSPDDEAFFVEKGGKTAFEDELITHWMPLPAPPNKGGE